MTARQKRIVFIILGLCAVAASSVMITKAMQSNLAYLYAPETVLAGEVPAGKLVRIGGFVKKGSLQRSDTSLDLSFVLTDKPDGGGNEVTVTYDRILPDLFKEEQSAVVKGKLDENMVMVAEEVLAKHDAEYMPEELKDVLEEEHTPATNKETEVKY
ncbi:cytochrome c maturation protein CcmE [Leucothrix sargassi]|nr:cytochrome c maturation protein CcmE [Leucothrix sargassi]